MSMDEQATWTQLFEGLRPALRLALDLEGATAGVLLVRDDVAPVFLPAVTEGLCAGDVARLRDIAPDVGALGTAIGRQRRVTITEQAAPDDQLAALARSVGMRSLAIVPLATQGECLGAMVLIRSDSPFPDEVDGWTASLTARCAGLAADAVAGIRARRRAEDAYTRIEALGRARLQFLARMTHELRTPLQAIDGYVEMLSAGVPEEATAPQLAVLARVRQCERVLRNVVDDLITYARLEAGCVEYHLSSVSAADALHAAYSVVAPLASIRDVTLVTEPTGDPVVVYADPEKLVQILINLAANALKFTPSGGTVRIGCTREGDGRATLFVSDNGLGIPLERLEEIFLPYVQLGAPLGEGAAGSGLGLAISREFAVGMRGELIADSGRDRGSTFRLRLPIHGANA